MKYMYKRNHLRVRVTVLPWKSDSYYISWVCVCL